MRRHTGESVRRIVFERMTRISWGRLVGASLTGYVVAVASLTVLFGNPFVKRILFTDDAGQSAKVLSVWLEQEPLPAVTPFWDKLGEVSGRGLVVQALLLVWSFAVAITYALGWVHRRGSRAWLGATFGLAMWAVLFLFFEAYVPFNILGEPFRLILLELALELVAMIAMGIAIAWVYSPRPGVE